MMDPEQNHDSVLSARGAKTSAHGDFMNATFTRVEQNPFHPVHNPKGIANLGTAVNLLLEDEVCERLERGDAFKFLPIHRQYFDVTGTVELRTAIAAFLTRHLHPKAPIIPSNVVTMAGATSCLESLTYALCDPGDVVITPTPVYGCIMRNSTEVAGACVEPLVLSQEQSNGESFELRAEDLDRRITELNRDQRRVRAFILLNPHNPMGQVYPPDLVLRLLQVCARHKMHVIVDEVYALTVHDEKVRFRSALTLDLPDPRRTHVVWALSKDFGLAGLRVGAVVSYSKEVLDCLHHCCKYKPIPLIVQQAANTILTDVAWCDEIYLPKYHKELREAYTYARDRLEGMGVAVRKSSAGLFLWGSVRAFLKHQTHQEDMALHEELLQAGVYTVPGKALYCADPGWMRVIFTTRTKELQAGLDRLEAVLSARRTTLQQNTP